MRMRMPMPATAYMYVIKAYSQANLWKKGKKN